MKPAIATNPRGTTNASAIELRWLLLLTWPIGYLLTYPYLPGYAFQYLALLTCAVLLNYLRLPLAETLPVWLILEAFWAKTGTFVSMAITLGFLRLLTGKRLGKVELSIGVTLILLGIALFPLFLSFRVFRSEGIGIVTSLVNSERELFAAGSLPGTMTFLYRTLVLRLTGAGALLAITLRHIQPLGLVKGWSAFWGPRSWTGYINVEIFDVSPKYIDNFGIAPGFVGLFYAVGGVVGVFFSGVVFFGATFYVWSLLGRLIVIPAPVSRAVFLDLMLWTIVDGSATMQMIKQMTIFVLSLMLGRSLFQVRLFDFQKVEGRRLRGPVLSREGGTL